MQSNHGMRAMGLSFAIGQRIGHENHGMRPQEVLPRDGDRRRFGRFKGSVFGAGGRRCPGAEGDFRGNEELRPLPESRFED